MAQLVFKDGSVAEAEGAFDEVLHRAFDEARKRGECVTLRTEKIRLLFDPHPGDTSGYKIVYGWMRNHEREWTYSLKDAVSKVFPRGSYVAEPGRD